MTLEPKTIIIEAPIMGTQETHRLAIYDWPCTGTEKGTVFCVHGLTRNGRDFDELAKKLCDEYRVIAIDMAGRGQSEWLLDPDQYNYPAYVADISYVFTQMKLSNVHWVGSSMGGIIGMLIANHFPGMIKTLTLNDIGCLIPATGLKRISTYVGTATNFVSRAEAEAELRRRCAPYGIEREIDWQHLFTYSIERTGNGNVRLAYDPNISQGFSANIQDIDLWGLWEKVQPIPTLLIRGTESDLLTHETALAMQSKHKNFQLLEVPGVGHAPALIDMGQIDAVRKRIL